MELLFVYGTLLENFEHPFALLLKEHSQVIGKGHFDGLLFDIGRYPGAIFIAGIDYQVYGNMVALKQAPMSILDMLDKYEGIDPELDPPFEYIRKKIPVIFNKNTYECWVYLYNYPINELQWIDSGDYQAYLDNGS